LKSGNHRGSGTAEDIGCKRQERQWRPSRLRGGLFLAADKLRKNLEPSDYKHVVLGLIFLRHISQAFEAKRAALLKEDAGAAEDSDEYLADNVFWVPKEARWSHRFRCKSAA
jgi:type I restriction-modification system DNA methylase subunit